MKTIRFVKNNSAKIHPMAETTSEMLEAAKAIAQNHDWDAEVYPAAMLSGDKKEERYGIVLVLEHSGKWDEVTSAAQAMLTAFHQGRILMATRRLTDAPQDVMEVGVISAMLPDKENILPGAAMRIHSELRGVVQACEGIDLTLYLYKDEKGIKIYSYVKDSLEEQEIKFLFTEIGCKNAFVERCYAAELVKSYVSPEE